MQTVELREETYQLLKDPLMGEETFDTTVRVLIELERKLKQLHTPPLRNICRLMKVWDAAPY